MADEHGSNQCPICKAQLKERIDYMDGYLICEQDAECPNGCYWYEFAYGGHRLRVAGVYFDWSYSETPEESKARRDAIQLVIDRNRITFPKWYWIGT